MLKEPTITHLIWFHEWALKHRSLIEVAGEMNVSISTMRMALRETSAWMRRHVYSDVMIRVRQSAVLDHCTRECLEEWNEKRDVRHLEQARKLMSDVREIWGVNKPPQKSTRDPRARGLLRVAGKTRAQAIRDQAEAMLKTAAHLEAQQAEFERHSATKRA